MNSSLSNLDSKKHSELHLFSEPMLRHISVPALVLSSDGEFVLMNDAMSNFAWGNGHQHVAGFATLIDNHGKEHFLRSVEDWTSHLLELVNRPDCSQFTFRGALQGDIRHLQQETIHYTCGEVYLCLLKYEAERVEGSNEYGHEQLFMGHSSAMMLVDTNSLMIVQANEAAANLYQTQRSTLIGMSFPDLELTRPEEILLSDLQGRSVREHAVAGKRRLMEIYGSLGQGAHQDILFLIVHDVTQREEAHVVLRTQERLLSTGETISQIGCWEWYPKTEKQVWTQQTYKVFQVDDVIPFKEWISRIVPEDRLRIELFFEYLTDTDELEALKNNVFRTEYRWQRNDGELVDIDLRVEVKVEDDEIVALRGSVQNISELRDREREVQCYAEKLERMNQSLEEFTSMASHDLREPARKVVAFGERVLRLQKDTLDSRSQDYIGRMIKAGQRMHGMIDSLLELSSCSTEAIMERHQDHIDVRELIEDVLSILEVRVEESRADIDWSDVYGMVMGDRDQLIHVFQNLIGNALKFHHPDQAPQVKIYCEEVVSAEGSMLRIVVKDHGIGLAACSADEIFKPFKRLHGKKSCYAGNGIGLSICKKIVENHGGKVSVESVVGEGSEFLVDLPRKRD